MSTRGFDEDEHEMDDLNGTEALAAEASPSTKLERRRKIEDLFEEKRLRKELEEFG